MGNKEVMKETTAQTNLEVMVSCPYCDACEDILERARETFLNGELSQSNCELEITCSDCKKEYIVTDIYY